MTIIVTIVRIFVWNKSHRSICSCLMWSSSMLMAVDAGWD